MKKFFISSFVLILTNVAFAYTGTSVCNYGSETIDSVVCYGPTVMKGTTVNGDIKVTGSLQAKNVSAKNVIVNGSTDISDSQITGSVTIVGSFVADHVVFSQGVSVESDSVTLNHSTVNGLMSITSSKKTPYLQMQCSSVISGSVLFDDKVGIVQITGDSIVKGKVGNGSMEFVKRSCE